jgi:hypothetical protein
MIQRLHLTIVNHQENHQQKLTTAQRLQNVVATPQSKRKPDTNKPKDIYFSGKVK